VRALGIEFPRECLADFAPRFIAGLVLVMRRWVLAADHVDDEFSIVSLQWKSGGFRTETLLHSLAIKRADIREDAVEPRGVIGQWLAVGRVEIDDAQDGAIRLFPGVKGGDALLRGFHDGVCSREQRNLREEHGEEEEECFHGCQNLLCAESNEARYGDNWSFWRGDILQN
jgi:hypothetical protein